MVVWPLLYVLMGAGALLYWRATRRRFTPALLIFIALVIALQCWWILFSRVAASRIQKVWSLVSIKVTSDITMLMFSMQSPAAAWCLAPLVDDGLDLRKNMSLTVEPGDDVSHPV
jgi:tryptophan-rich sensory protein